MFIFLQVQYTTQSFTLFYVWTNFIFLCFTFLFVVIFAWSQRKSSWRSWTIDQQWMAILFFGLVGWNSKVPILFSLKKKNLILGLKLLIWFCKDPFYVLEVLSPTIGILVSSTLSSFFLTALLVYFVLFFDMIKENATTSLKISSFYLPKVGLSFFSFIVILSYWLSFSFRIDDTGAGSLETVSSLFFTLKDPNGLAFSLTSYKTIIPKHQRYLKRSLWSCFSCFWSTKASSCF